MSNDIPKFKTGNGVSIYVTRPMATEVARLQFENIKEISKWFTHYGCNNFAYSFSAKHEMQLHFENNIIPYGWYIVKTDNGFTAYSPDEFGKLYTLGAPKADGSYVAIESKSIPVE